MAEDSKKRVCLACGEQYSYCPTCDKDRDKPTWMFVFDSQRCKDIFTLLEEYAREEHTKAEMRKELLKLEISCVTDRYTPGIKMQLEEIFSGELIEAPKKTKVKTELS